MSYRLYIWPKYAFQWRGNKISLSKTQGTILARLHNSPVSLDDLTDILYGDREDGGPETSSWCIRVAICHLRRKLKGSPIGIDRAHSGIYRIIDRVTKTADSIADSVLDD